MTLTSLAQKHNIDPESAQAFLQEWLDMQEPIAWTSPGREVLHRATKDTVYGSHTVPLIARPTLGERKMTMNITDIEKCAKLLGLHELEYRRGSDAWYYTNPDSGREEFNPYSNKADLSDVIDELEIDIGWFPTYVKGYSFKEYDPISFKAEFANYPTKFDARAHAVMAVVEQIYDRQFGGE